MVSGDPQQYQLAPGIGYGHLNNKAVRNIVTCTLHKNEYFFYIVRLVLRLVYTAFALSFTESTVFATTRSVSLSATRAQPSSSSNPADSRLSLSVSINFVSEL